MVALVTTEAEAMQAILDRVAELAPNVNSESKARAVAYLAEAHAWFVSPSQPHGGIAVASASS